MNPGFGACIEFIRRGIDLTADSVTAIDGGIVVSTPTLPTAWGVNQLRISEPMSFAAALDLAERHLGHLPFRHVVIEHEATAERLEAPFRRAGWHIDCEVIMAHVAEPDRPAASVPVIEPGEESMIALMARWHLDEHPDASVDELTQMEEFTRREGRARLEQRLGVVDDGGTLAAMAKIRFDGATAQVEDVYTVPGERGRGYARALVTTAVRHAEAAGNGFIFIVADDNDWPKHLYSRIGFRPVGRTRSLHLDVRRLSG